MFQEAETKEVFDTLTFLMEPSPQKDATATAGDLAMKKMFDVEDAAKAGALKTREEAAKAKQDAAAAKKAAKEFKQKCKRLAVAKGRPRKRLRKEIKPMKVPDDYFANLNNESLWGWGVGLIYSTDNEDSDGPNNPLNYPDCSQFTIEIMCVFLSFCRFCSLLFV
jgi:hypothetical protein